MSKDPYDERTPHHTRQLEMAYFDQQKEVSDNIKTLLTATTTMATNVSHICEKVKDHETRIREGENFRGLAKGAWAGITVLFTVVATWLGFKGA